MSDQRPRIVSCDVCGNRMAVPPGYKKSRGKCSVCGAAVSLNPEEQSGGDALANLEAPSAMLGDSSGSGSSISVPLTAIQKRRESRIHAIGAGLGYGVLGGLGGGLLLAVVMQFLGSTGEGLSLKALIADGSAGFTLGFIVLGSWGLIRRLAVGIVPGLIIGLCLSVPVSALFYLLEWWLIAQPDMPLIGAVAVGAFAGLVGAAIVWWFTEEE